MENKKNEHLIGIPTIEGIEIILVNEIIRCEGLQKCTRIVTCSKKDIISSYSIGDFRKLLGQFHGFFSPHRSYLINLLYVSKLKNAGEIVMKDGSGVPLTKNKKNEFLSLITLL